MSTDANAPGVRPTCGHGRGLDGIRALSTLAHHRVSRRAELSPAGFYGVDAFIVLSGFSITSSLVQECGGPGTIPASALLAGRARRRMPALFVLVSVIGTVVTVMPRLQRNRPPINLATGGRPATCRGPGREGTGACQFVPGVARGRVVCHHRRRDGS